MEWNNYKDINLNDQNIDSNSNNLPTPFKLINENCDVGRKECETKDAELNILTVVDEILGQDISTKPSI